MVKSKKGGKQTRSIHDDGMASSGDEGGGGEDDDVDAGFVRSQKKSVFQFLDVEDNDDDDPADDGEDDEVQVASTSTKKKPKKKKAKTDDVDAEFDFNFEKVDSKPAAKKEKKSKKDKKKRNDDEDEIERMLAELELEYEGKKPAPSAKVVADAAADGTTAVEEDKPVKTKKKGRRDENHENDHEPKVVVTAEEPVVETKAAKKRKEPAKQKKQEKDRDVSETREAVSPSRRDSSSSEAVPRDDQHGSQAKADKGKKSAKSSAAATAKPEKDEKKRPGKKQLLAMQEALKKIKEEEERLRLEEEAKLRAAEEAELQRIEQLRLEKERKELKKQHEKERRERLKAEGKLLTKAQKAERARVMATIEALRAQGVVVPAIGEKKERIVRPGTRPRTKKVRPTRATEDHQQPEEEKDLESESQEPLPDAQPTSQEPPPAESEVPEAEPEGQEHVKDAWDESSSEDEAAEEATATKVAPKQVHIKIKEEVEATSKGKSDGQQEKPSRESPSPTASGSDDTDESESSSSDDEDDDDDDDQRTAAEKAREKALDRIQARRERNESNRTVDHLRSPIVCVLGHVDTGKTKILDKIRHTHVQDGEAGGITQQIGATMVPVEAIREQAKMVKNFAPNDIRYPGVLIIDTPGHESFSNLRSRGSSLCDIAILVVDIMHGLEPQTLESISLLKKRKTPFVVALNKIDRLYEWKSTRNKDIRDTIKGQNRNTILEFEERVNHITVQFAEQGLNAALFYENRDVRTYVSFVPTSATTGEGMGNLLALIVELTQAMLAKRLAFTEELQATVLELKAIPGLGTTMDVILVNGSLREGDTMVLAGMDGPVVTPIRSLLMPQPLKELRVKNPYQEYKEVKAAQGIKVTAKDLEKVIAGLNLTVAHHPDEVEILKEEVSREFHAAMSAIKLAERGVYVQASTLGSLEALLEFLRTSKIPSKSIGKRTVVAAYFRYSGIRIGPVVKRDVMKASIMLEHESQYAVVLAFDVKVERDAQELADSLGVRIFSADIIYHLFDRFTEYRERLRNQKRDELRSLAVFPCRLRILPNCIFNSRDPIVVGVSVEAGVVKDGTPLCVPSKEFLEIGVVTTIEINHKQIDCARKGQEVCIKIEPIGGEAPKLYGRHFDHTDMLVSKITRQSIDVCKEYFRDDLQKSDWQLMVDLKKLFQIM